MEIKNNGELEDVESQRKTTRFIVDEPQTYKVVGYSIKRPTEHRRLGFNISLSKHEPLDVRPYMNKMTLISN